MKESFANIEEFIKSLDMQIDFEEMNDNNITRIEELINKSNQFNLTTRRYNKSTLEKMKEKSLIYVMKVRDKFDDLGIVGIGIVKFNENIAEIDLFLLSCRVIGRKVEYQFLDFLLDLIKEKKYNKVIGRYLRTAKNSQVQNFYLNAGFDIMEQTDAETLYIKEI